MKRLTIITACILLFAAIALGYYMYNKPHINVLKENVDYVVSVDSVVHEFLVDVEKSNLKYHDKIIQITGKFSSQSVSESHLATIVIKGEDRLVNCEMDSLYAKDLPIFQPDDEITIKGLFVGYDDLLEELQLKKCLYITE